MYDASETSSMWVVICFYNEEILYLQNQANRNEPEAEEYLSLALRNPSNTHNQSFLQDYKKATIKQG